MVIPVNKQENNFVKKKDPVRRISPKKEIVFLDIAIESKKMKTNTVVNNPVVVEGKFLKEYSILNIFFNSKRSRKETRFNSGYKLT